MQIAHTVNDQLVTLEG